MIEAYRRREDLHRLTAQRLTGRQDVSKQERQLAKPINFGLIYGQGAKGLMRKAKAEYGVNMQKEQAEQYREAFFTAWPGIARWHRALEQQQRRGVTETRTLTGRRV